MMYKHTPRNSPRLVLMIHIQNLEKTKVSELKKSLMENYYINIPDTDKEGNQALIFGFLAAKLVACLSGDKYCAIDKTKRLPIRFTNFGSCAALLFLNELDSTIKTELILKNIPTEVWDTKKFETYRQNQSQISTNEEASNETRRLGIYHSVNTNYRNRNSNSNSLFFSSAFSNSNST